MARKVFSSVDGKSCQAFAIYLTISIIFFGLPILEDPSHLYIGNGYDPVGADNTAHMWFLAWWPYAFLNGLNPFLTDMVWAPKGVNLAWTTAIPGPSLLASPITLTFGPVVSYNVLSLLAPALSAWAGYILCRNIVKRHWESLAGGYVFGFSPYELFHMMDHPSLSLTFMVPLIVYLVLLRLDESL